MDILEALIKAWDMYHSNPIFWIIVSIVAIPIILKWWNVTKRELVTSGLVELFFSIKSKLLNRRTERQRVITPSPKSGTSFILWRELIVWPVLMSPFVLSIGFITTIPRFSVQWWTMVGWFTLFIIFIFGMPIYASIIMQWLKIKQAIKTANERLQQININDEIQTSSYLDIFIEIADDLLTGLDPRVLPVAYQSYKIDVLPFLDELMSLQLVKPDKETKRDTLARRYYLTRIGSTLAKKIKQQEVKR